MEPNSSHRMDKGLRDLATESPSSTHQAEMLTGARQKMRRIQQMKKRVTRVSWGAGGTVFLMIALLMIPITYEVTVGCVVSLNGVSLNESYAQVYENLTSLEQLRNHDVTIINSLANFQLVFKKMSRRKATELITEILTESHVSLTGLEISSENLVVEVGGNALAYATNGVISINISDLDDTEIETAIVSQLTAAGYTNSSAHITTEDGVTNITIGIDVDERVVTDTCTTRTIAIEFIDDQEQ